METAEYYPRPAQPWTPILGRCTLSCGCRTYTLSSCLMILRTNILHLHILITVFGRKKLIRICETNNCAWCFENKKKPTIQRSQMHDLIIIHQSRWDDANNIFTVQNIEIIYQRKMPLWTAKPERKNRERKKTNCSLVVPFGAGASVSVNILTFYQNFYLNVFRKIVSPLRAREFQYLRSDTDRKKNEERKWKKKKNVSSECFISELAQYDQKHGTSPPASQFEAIYF